jgi:hypothetical protein
MRIFLKIENLDILTLFSIAWRVDRIELRNSWLEINFKSSQEIDIEYLGWARMLISKLDPTINLLIEREKKSIRKKFNAYNLVIVDRNLLFAKNKRVNREIKLLLIAI